MGRKVYISFKTEDVEYKTTIQKFEQFNYVDKSMNESIDSEDEDYILRRIRSDYLADSTVTIHLIGLYGTENQGWEEQRFIKRELQASLYNAKNNTKNGILGVVLPAAKNKVYGRKTKCDQCGESHDGININDETTIREFSYNYYIPNGKCTHVEEDRYCVLVSWDEFVLDPERYIEAAFSKRSAPIANKTRVRPIGG